MITCAVYDEVSNWTLPRLHKVHLDQGWLDEQRRLYGREMDKRFIKFANDANAKPGMYMFIVTNEQQPNFLEDVEQVNLTKTIVKQFPCAINANYPEQGPRLHMYLLNIKGQ